MHFLPAPRRDNWARFCWHEGALSGVECDTIIALGQSRQKERATVDNLSGQKEIRKSEVVWIEAEPASRWIFERLGALALSVNRERYHFDLTGFTEKLQYTEYGEDGHYGWHQDFAAGDFSNRKLSLVALLSDPADYDAGHLEFFNAHDEVPRTRGTVIFFPAFEFHRVVPVSRGLRRSLVAWIGGPPFR